MEMCRDTETCQRSVKGDEEGYEWIEGYTTKPQPLAHILQQPPKHKICAHSTKRMLSKTCRRLQISRKVPEGIRAHRIKSSENHPNLLGDETSPSTPPLYALNATQPSPFHNLRTVVSTRGSAPAAASRSTMRV